MRILLRAARRFTVTGWFALAALLLVVAQGRAATPLEKMLPDSTVAYVEVQDAAALRAAFLQSQLGQLANDPALKAYKNDIIERLDEAGKILKETVGLSYRELFALPQGPAALALLNIKNPSFPLALVAIADAGKNATAMNDALNRTTKEGERKGAKVSTEVFRGVSIHVIQIPEDDQPVKDKDKEKDKDEEADKDDEGPDVPVPPIVWSSQGSVFYLSTDLDAVKDLIAHAQGRDDGLVASETYNEAVKKLGSNSNAPVFWYIDLRKAGSLLVQLGNIPDASGKAGLDLNDVRKMEALFQGAGLSALRAAAGNIALNAGNFDSISRTMLLLQGPAQGLLKVFRLPKVGLQPEPWVPASVATYQSISWDLDNASVALSELANQIEPGVVDAVEKQLVNPEGGQPLRFKQDIFGPLGDRITIISDFKKPIREDSKPTRLALYLDTQRMGVKFGEGGDVRTLIGVALEDSKKFENTLNTLIALTGAQPKKREFQGTTIYDFDLPEITVPDDDDDDADANVEGGKKIQLRGPICVAIAKETLFISREPSLLELVLRGGGPSLADSESYRAFARETPNRLSSVFYIRPEEQARLTYAMVKNGQFETFLEGAAVRVGTDLASIAGLVDKKKMPEFSVFAKYRAQAGRFSESSEDSLTITSFSLRKTKH